MSADHPHRREVLATLGAGAAVAALPAEAASPAKLLEDQVVLSANPTTRVLYTWTTKEQIFALRHGAPLLERARSPRHGLSRFDRALRATTKDQQHPLHAHLLSDGYMSRRFAWAQPWGTLLGWGEETYGDQLIRIELKPEALVASVQTGDRPRRWLTHPHGQPTPRPSAAEDVGKIGAVFHIHEGGRYCGPSTHKLVGTMMVREAPAECVEVGTFGSESRFYREYILFDPAQIARWSYGDRQCRAALRADIELVGQLISAQKQLSAEGLRWPPATEAWLKQPTPGRPVPSMPDEHRLRQLYIGALPWTSPPYTPERRQLKALQAALRKALKSQGKPLSSP
ncbi:MAG: hypothetical protein ACE366_26925 [Bradymonadia bacterium]